MLEKCCLCSHEQHHRILWLCMNYTYIRSCDHDHFLEKHQHMIVLRWENIWLSLALLLCFMRPLTKRMPCRRRLLVQVQPPVPFNNSVNKNPAFSRYMEQPCMMLPPPQTHMHFTRLINYKFVCIILTNINHFTFVHLMELFLHNM